MTFIPLILWGLYEIICGNYKKWHIIAIGYICLIMSHLLSAVLMLITIIIFLIIYHKRIIKEPVRLTYLSIAGAVSLIVSGGFLFPLIEQMLSNQFYYNIIYPNMSHDSSFSLIRIMQGLFNGFSKAESEQLPSVGVLLTIPIITRIFIDKKNHLLKTIDSITIIGFCYIFAVSNLFPWNIYPFKVLNIIQFPSRLYLFVSFFFAVSGAYYLNILTTNKRTKTICIFVFITLTTFMLARNGKTFQEPEYLENHQRFTPIACASNYYHLVGVEYVSTKFPMEPKSEDNPVYNFPDIKYIEKRRDKINFKQNSTQINNYQRKWNTTIANITIPEPDILEFPLFFYKGYTATLNDKKIDVTESSLGLVEMKINESGEVKVWYAGTPVQKISFYISLVSGILFCIYIFLFHLFSPKKLLSKRKGRLKTVIN